MNNKGQALIEFVLILPIFLFILFVIVDFGIIFSSKSSLESNSTDIVNLIINGEDIDYVNSLYDDYSINISMSDDDKYYNIEISEDIKIMTPGLNKILGNPYVISVKRVVINDKA